MDWLKSRTIVGLDNPIKPIESIRTINIDVEKTWKNYHMLIDVEKQPYV